MDDHDRQTPGMRASEPGFPRQQDEADDTQGHMSSAPEIGTGPKYVSGPEDHLDDVAGHVFIVPKDDRGDSRIDS